MKKKMKSNWSQFQQMAIVKTKLNQVKGGDDSVIIEDYIDG